MLDVQRHDDFVSHAADKDLYAAIDLVAEKGERQLREFKDKLKNGKHTFAVRAVAGGLTDPTPATYKFKIKRKRA